jgi:hypothetical protein
MLANDKSVIKTENERSEKITLWSGKNLKDRQERRNERPDGDVMNTAKMLVPMSHHRDQTQWLQICTESALDKAKEQKY